MDQLSQWTWHDFMEMPNVGVVTVAAIARIARELGYPLGSGLEESAEAKELAARNGITVMDSDRITDLAFQLMVLGREQDLLTQVNAAGSEEDLACQRGA